MNYIFILPRVLEHTTSLFLNSLFFIMSRSQARISSDITATHGRVMRLTHMLPIAVAQTVTLPTPQQLHSRVAPYTFLRALRHAGVRRFRAGLARQHLARVEQMVRHQLGVSGVSGIVADYACG